MQKGFSLGSVSDLSINFDTTPRDFAFFKKSPNNGFSLGINSKPLNVFPYPLHCVHWGIHPPPPQKHNSPLSCQAPPSPPPLNRQTVQVPLLGNLPSIMVFRESP